MNLFTLIGLFVVVKFVIRNRRMFMDKQAFWDAVKELRYGIYVVGGSKESDNHKNLDKLIKTVTGRENMSEELDLQEDVVRIIKRIKEAKEDAALKEKAGGLIDKLKAEL